MKSFAKIFLAAFLTMFSVCGCKNLWNGGKNEYYNTPTNSVIQAGFNDEVYVWEDFVFSTNRVQNAR